jgi:hypothetical protein
VFVSEPGRDAAPAGLRRDEQVLDLDARAVDGAQADAANRAPVEARQPEHVEVLADARPGLAPG